MKYILTLLVAIFSSSVIAGTFTCTVSNVTTLSGNGDLVKDDSWLKLASSRDQFIVDGSSGVITSHKMLKNNHTATPKVTKNGGSSNSFIAVTDHPSGDVTLLQIQQFKPNMPFLYVATFVGQVTGTCSYSL